MTDKEMRKDMSILTWRLVFIKVGRVRWYLVSARELNIYWSKFFASPIDRSWFQRPRLVKARSRSSASESCDAIATRELEDIPSMFSSEDILAVLALGDNDDALETETCKQN